MEEEVMQEEVPLEETSLHTNYLLWVVVGLAITTVFIIVLSVVDRKRRKKINEQMKE